MLILGKKVPRARMEVHLALPPDMSLSRARHLFKRTLKSGGITSGRIRFKSQSPGNLGDRMTHSFLTGFRRSERVVIWGSDIPLMDTDSLVKAATEEKAALVPATDGGYSLIGLSKRDFNEKLLANIPWSADNTYKIQKERLRESGIPMRELPEIPDLDTVEDIAENIDFMETNAQVREYQQILSELREFLENLPLKN